MWLFTIYGFFSVACIRRKDGSVDDSQVSVRARSIKHLKSLQRRFGTLKGYKIVQLQNRDYRYRINIPKKIWADALFEMSNEQTWDNFKNAATTQAGGLDHVYVSALHAVWNRMLDLQEGMRRFNFWRKAEVEGIHEQAIEDIPDMDWDR